MERSNNGSSIAKNVMWKFAERILAQMVSLIVSIILARLLLPEEYGIVSMVMVFITIANVFVVSGIPNGLIYVKDADDLDFSSTFYFNLGFSIILYALMFIAAPYIAEFYNSRTLIPVFRVLGLRIVVASINSIQHSYVSKKMQFKKYFLSTLLGTVLSGVVGVYMAYIGAGVWALVAQYMINTTVDTIVLFITVAWRPKLLFSWKRVSFIWKYGWKILVEALSETLTVQCRSLIIGKVYSSSDLAYYDKGNQFPSILVGNICTSISSVLFPAISNEQDDNDRVVQLLRNSVRITSYVIFPLLTGLAVVAPSFVQVVLTEKWMDCVDYLRLFCVIQGMTVVMIPRHQALLGTGRSDIYMYEHVVYRVFAVILLLSVYKTSVLMITVSLLISSIVMVLTVMYTSRKYNGYVIQDQIKDVLPTIIGCIVMAIPIYIIGKQGLNCLYTLIIQICVGGATYLLYSHILKLPEYKYVITLCKKVLHKEVR